MRAIPSKDVMAALEKPSIPNLNGKALPFTEDAEIVEFLETAEITFVNEIVADINRPKNVILKKDGVAAHAISSTMSIVDATRQGSTDNYIFPSMIATSMSVLPMCSVTSWESTTYHRVWSVDSKGTMARCNSGSRTRSPRETEGRVTRPQRIRCSGCGTSRPCDFSIP